MRIVSLCPSLTELVFDLGRGSDLVGITRYCVHPADGVTRIPKVGGTKDPDVARIVALKPDLVLLNEEENRLDDAESLRAAGLPLHVSLPRTVSETADMVRSIAEALDRRDAGAAIATDIETRCARVEAAAVGLAPVRFAYLIWRKPWMTVNHDTFAHALLSLAGGRNVFATAPDRYPELQLPQLVEAAPDVVFLCTEPYAFADEHRGELARLTGFERERFRIADGEYLSWHGSRTADGIDYAEGLVRDARVLRQPPPEAR